MVLGTRIATVDEGAFENLPALVQVLLNDNPNLTFVHPESFKNLPSLRTLFLHNSNLSTVYNFSAKLPALQNWTLYGNPLVCDCNLKWLQWYIRNNTSERFSRLLCFMKGTNKSELVKDAVIDDHCSPRIVHCPSALQLYEGQSLKLNCQAIGNPLPQIEWYSPDMELISRSSSAHIENVNATHEGIYEFVAKSGKGIVRYRVKVKVSFFIFPFFF